MTDAAPRGQDSGPSAGTRNGGGAGSMWAISVVYHAHAVIGIILIRRIAAAQRPLDGSRLDEAFA